MATLARLLKSLQAILEGEDYILKWLCFHVGVQGLGLKSLPYWCFHEGKHQLGKGFRLDRRNSLMSLRMMERRR